MNAKARILVVDDEEVVRLSVSRVLAAAHCKVEAVWTWDQVSALMAREPFDVVLLDLRMPGVDGIAMLRALKARWPDSEVVVITGYPTLDTAMQAVALGAHGYLAKPVGPEQIVGAARAALRHKRWALHREARADVAARAPDPAHFTAPSPTAPTSSRSSS